jgi:hypothetical protein
MKVHQKPQKFQLPDLFDWAGELERRSASHRVRWVARDRRVFLATAATLIANAGFDRGQILANAIVQIVFRHVAEHFPDADFNIVELREKLAEYLRDELVDIGRQIACDRRGADNDA